MQFVNVAISDHFIDDMSVDITGNSLVSLYEAMNTKRFGLNNPAPQSVRKQKMIDYSKRIRNKGAKLYVDSGGYSIITGRVNFQDIEEYEEYYQEFLEKDSEHYDYIFSLDIPYGIEDEKLKDRQVLHAFNYRVLNRSFDAISRNPALKEKFIFIYHFRMLDLWDVWQKLYSELDIGKKVIHRAIGGMVGLKGMNRHIDYSGFTFIIFRLFYDFMQSGIEPEEFKIHLLGVSHPIERLMITIIEKALNNVMYSSNQKTKITFTYDSLSYSYDAWKKFNKMNYWDFNGKLSSFKLGAVPPQVMSSVYQANSAQAQSEIQNHQAGQDLNKSSIFVPLSIYSQTQLDKFFMFLVDDLNIIKRMNINNQIPLTQQFYDQVADIRDDMFQSYKPFFQNYSEARVESELKMVAGLINWLAYLNDPVRLETATRNYIEKLRT